MALKSRGAQEANPVRPEAGGVDLEGELAVPGGARGLVLLAHGSGASRKNIRNRAVARRLFEGGLATLVFDLLTPSEQSLDRQNGELRRDIDLLAERFARVADWARRQPPTAALRVGYFGSSTAGAAALAAAAALPDQVSAVVCRAGRPDLAEGALPRVGAPTLLIVGGEDRRVLSLNLEAMDKLGMAEKRLDIVRGATRLFQEPGALEIVARLAREWLLDHLDDAFDEDELL